MTALVVVAHSSHWLANVAYMLPVLAFLAWLGTATLRERRRAARERERVDAGDRRPQG